MTFTEKLELLMERRGLTRGTLAEVTGVPYATIVGFYTKGYHNIKLSTLKRIADYFEVSLDILADDAVGPEFAAPAHVAFARYNRLTPGERQIVDALILGLEDMRKSSAKESSAGRLSTIPVLQQRAAAGSANPVFTEEYVDEPRSAEVPETADFAVDVSGVSMEPWIPDGKRVYCVRQAGLSDGDVGIFIADGEMKCKQYLRDAAGGVHLISLNRACKSMDSHFSVSDGRTLVCLGKVLMTRRAPLPRDLGL